jgi:hypothetical protein
MRLQRSLARPARAALVRKVLATTRSSTSAMVTADLPPGQLAHLALDRHGPLRGSYRLGSASAAPLLALPARLATPRRWVRVLCLNKYGLPLDDVTLNSAASNVAERSGALPANTRQVVAIHQGWRCAAPPNTSTGIAEPVGLEPATRLLALGGTHLAAHGCTVQIRTVQRDAIELFDTVSGEAVLKHTRHLELQMPAMPRGCSLIIKAFTPTRGLVGTPVSWKANAATLASSLPAMYLPEGVAYVMGVTAATRWQLDLQLAPHWRLAGVVCVPLEATQVQQRLSAGLWDWIDDTYSAADGIPSTLTLELQP